jgi:HrpA-like RNA helicase
MLKLGPPETFLSSCIDPPSILNIRLAISRLIDIGAVAAERDLPLTPLGMNIAMLPMDAMLGKMLIYAVILNCVEPILTVVAFLSGKSPFLMTVHKRDEYYKRFLKMFGTSDPFSDHLAVVSAFNSWNDIRRNQGPLAAEMFCRENFLSPAILEDISDLRYLFKRHLINAGFMVDDHSFETLNIDGIEGDPANNTAIGSRLLSGSFSSSLARFCIGAGRMLLRMLM